MTLREKVDFLIRTLDTLYPDPQIPLRHSDPFTFLVAVMLSAQTTDKRVNEVTPALFAAASTPEQMAGLPVERIVSLIHPVGLAPTKGRNLQAMSRILVERYGGEVPRTFEELRSPPRGRTQDGLGDHVPGFRRTGLSGRYAHPPADAPLGAFFGQECGADRAGCQTVVSPASLDAPALADHLLRAGVFSGAGGYLGARCDHGPAQSPGAALIFTEAVGASLRFLWPFSGFSVYPAFRPGLLRRARISVILDSEDALPVFSGEGDKNLRIRR